MNSTTIKVHKSNHKNNNDSTNKSLNYINAFYTTFH